MKRVTTEQLTERIHEAFRTVDAEGMKAAQRAVLGPDVGSMDDLAARMADPAWSRFAVRDLDGASLAVLRLLPRLRHGALTRELDLLGRLVAPQTNGAAPPSQQLMQAGVAVPYRDPYSRGRELRLRVLGPLRERWITLTETPPDPTIVPDPSEAEERHRAQRAEYEIGVLLAAVEHTRPRATRLREMHRGDEKAIIDLVSTLCGGDEQAHARLSLIHRRGLLVAREGRLAVQTEALADWKDPLLKLLLDRIAERRHSTAWRVAFAQLIAAASWISMQRLLEVSALAALQEAHSYDPVRIALSECGDLARHPAVLTTRVGDTMFVRLTSATRRALQGQPSISSAYAGGLLVQPNLQIMVQPGVPLAVIAQLGSFARLVSADQVAIFALDETSTRRAAAEGWTSSEILGLFEKHASLGVPSTVARALSDWARTRARATLASGLIALIDLPFEEVSRVAGRVHVDKVADGVYRVASEAGDAFIQALRKAGVACRSFVPPEEAIDADQDEPTESVASSRSLKDFVEQGQVDLQQLLQHLPSDG